MQDSTSHAAHQPQPAGNGHAPDGTNAPFPPGASAPESRATDTDPQADPGRADDPFVSRAEVAAASGQAAYSAVAGDVHRPDDPDTRDYWFGVLAEPSHGGTVTLDDLAGRVEPPVLERVLSYRRHYSDAGAGPYWLEGDLDDLVGLAAYELRREAAGGAP